MQVRGSSMPDMPIDCRVSEADLTKQVGFIAWLSGVGAPNDIYPRFHLVRSGRDGSNAHLRS